NRVVADDLHLEADRAVGDDASDVSQSYDTKSLVADLRAHEFGALPFAGFDGRGRGGNLTRHRHHHGDGVLGGGNTVAQRAVHYYYATARGSFEVDIVDAHPSPSDHFQRGGRLDYIAGHFGPAPNQQSIVGPNDRR